LPGDDSNSRNVSAPESNRKAVRSTPAFAPKALPLALRQLWQ